MKQRPPMFTPTPDADAYDITAPGVMLLLADTAHGSGRANTSPSGRANAKDGYEALLDATRAGGYTQTDILHTLLVKAEVSHRVKEMAHAACDAAGSDRIDAVFAAMRERIKGAG